MYIPFDTLSAQARVWVYQASRPLTETEQALIEKTAPDFLESWATHGKPLKASYKLFHDQFLVIGVDENHQQASGCSIDSSVAFVQALEKELGLSFMDRGKVAFVLEDKIYMEPLPSLKRSIEAGKITADTQTFNNLVSNKQELEEKWLQPAKETWLKRYFS
ncbi:hypothetical protein [Nafulsella turpanensis]|uniref:hypothetical protein n=1 Tax=Nafulsella turpanensis TaxID=1265690 RepID=UPI0003458D53|nr:hypothetical protein [Nafulsella turpanensis]